MEAKKQATQQLNRDLRELYLRAWPELMDIVESRRPHGISAPYLASASDSFVAAGRRLVVVGKETNTWFNSNIHEISRLEAPEAVDFMMEKYRSFDLGRKYKGRGSFWTPVRELSRRLVGEGHSDSDAFVALNISKFDERGSKPPTSVLEAQLATDLLKGEIEILQPEVVVFHTGPSYDKWIPRWFPGAEIEGDRWLATIKAPSLPPTTFRSYHPQYLNRTRQRGKVYSRIADRVLPA